MDVYKGEAKSIKSYLKNDFYFYIPEYQRAYSWSGDNVSDLLSSITKGLTSFEIGTDSHRQENFSSYLGCIIDWVRNSKNSDKKAEYQNETYIDKVRELIDGQQRTSTFAILCSRLFYQFEILIQKLNVESDSESKILAEVIIDEYCTELLSCFSRTDGRQEKFRPFLIREGVDKWSISDSNTYESPVSKYLSDFIDYTSSRPDEIFFDLRNFPSSTDRNLADALKSCDEEISSTLDNLSSIKFLGDKFVGKELFKGVYSGFNKFDLIEYMERSPENKGVIQEIIALAAFTKYLLDFCFITIISSPSEEKSLDIFQQINSTGQQLSAFDLVKPRISLCFRNENKLFNEMPAFKIFNKVADWLKKNDAIGGQRKRCNTRTNEFFEIAMHYFSVQSPSPYDLGGQRKIITEGFSNFINSKANNLVGLTTSEKAHEFCLRLESIQIYLDSFKLNYNFSDFGEYKKRGENLYLSNDSRDVFTNTAAFNFLFLLKSKHSVCNALLVHFYHGYRVNPSLENKKMFEKVINNSAVFFSIFRLVGNIHPDAFWKSFYSDIQIFESNDFVSLLANFQDSYNSAAYRAFQFDINKLDKDLVTTNLVKNIRYNGRANSLIRYTLLIASDSTVPASYEGEECGLLLANNKGSRLISPEYWLSRETSTIEHIAPQECINGKISVWPPEFNGSSDIINSIGNLTLLGQVLNSSVQTDAYKKAEVFAKSFDNQFSFPNQDKETYISHYCQTVVDAIDKQHLLKPVSLRLCQWLSNDVGNKYSWDSSFIQKRSENIASLYIDKCIEMVNQS
ncbi:GmrSD restriction endonuclease domain-containing protein [Pseudoalteromonas sp. ZZD1]|uniref:GmrSD restriction endonuclease domain-containing protein n=1 Tax=Pseudoalteromonas sp. ZZD1 TaxID=3139395 RepID=UPI003BAD2502